MKNNTLLKAALIFTGLALIAWGFDRYFQNKKAEMATPSPLGRIEWETMRLADPATGKIPENIRVRELQNAAMLPVAGAQRDSMAVDFQSIGPYNVGGRTRAFAIDKANPNLYLAGGVSGGMWRSVDAGENWNRVTPPGFHAATSCISQDPRNGKNNIWYYGSGEVSGNSASKSFSAYYRGNGIYKSTDAGATWTQLSATAAVAQKASDWDAVFRVLVDPTRNDSDIVFAATKKGIMRSNDGGDTWENKLGGNITADFVDLLITTDGQFYATISTGGGGSFTGFWRSDDGQNWVEITPSGFPSDHERTLMYSPSINQNLVFFYSGTPSGGVNQQSLWKYNYISGDGTGSGGAWTSLSAGLENVEINIYGGYCQVLAVKPDNPDVIFIGGTNLYRSTSGFQDTLNTRHIGGYRIYGDTNFTYREGLHYPDQQFLAFHPFDTDIMISTTDGGIHRTNNCTADSMQYERVGDGYVCSQFYHIAIDRETAGSEVVMGGLQDRGTFYTDVASPTVMWSSLRGADGAFCAVEDGGQHFYSSTQYANIRRFKVDAQGNTYDGNSVMPPNAEGGYLFVHPFTLDPVDNDIMYLPRVGQVWRNDNLPAADNEDLSHWDQIAQVSGTITAISASEAEQGVVYIGTRNGLVYRMDNAHTANNVSTVLISNEITSSGYTANIAIDPEDADRAIVVYSNYNIISLWLTKDGGQTWTPIEGNLKGTSEPGVPENLYFIGDGPSTRWAKIIKTSENGEVVMLGTSVGVFSTREMNGDSTVWKQEGANTIGNVVVDVIDYRPSDGWIVAGTHGNGIFAGHLGFYTPAGLDEEESAVAKLYPNPTSDQLNIQLTSNQTSANWSIYNLAGKKVKAGSQLKQINVADLSSGIYLIDINTGEEKVVKRFVKH